MANQHSHAQTAHRVLGFDMDKNDWPAPSEPAPTRTPSIGWCPPYYSVMDEPQLPHLSL
jgi:hypothetical protein